MTDENFRDLFCDDIFCSMKAQMEPSDDVVASLLAKIAAETPSPVTENDNVIPFRTPEITSFDLFDDDDEIDAEEAALAELESTPRKHFAQTRRGSKKKNKSIWYYGTAVAASIVVLISTFALIGTGDNADDMKDLFHQAVGSQTPVVGTNPSDEDGTYTDGSTDADPADGDDKTGPDESKSKEDSDSNNKDKAPDADGNKDATDSHKSDSNGSDSNKNKNSSSSSDTPSKKDDSSSSKPVDNGKITPGASGSTEIPWTNEIISTSQVASISVSGSNYVVENTLSRSDVGATIETVTIQLPQTSTTNAAQVTATVHKVKNVSSAAMVALDVEGFDQPLVYANPDYSPSSLGELVSDLGLEGHISFSGSVRCQISKVGYSSNHNYSVNINSATWTYLLDQKNAERASYSNFSNGNSKALFTSSSNPTNTQIQFGVSDNGYLYISLSGKKHTFNIGSANAKGFIEYVSGESLE